MKKILIVLAALSTVTFNSVFSQARLKPQDWVGDFVEKLEVYNAGFELEMQYEKSYHELGEKVIINRTIVSLNPITVEQYAYFLERYMEEKPGKAINEDWIPSSIALTKTGKVTFAKEDAENMALVSDIDGARAFCIWLTGWVNTSRTSSRLPELPFFRITSLGESIMATDDEDLSLYFVNDEDYSMPATELDAGIIHENVKNAFNAEVAAGFFVGISVRNNGGEGN